MPRDDIIQRCTIEHIDHIKAIRNLHRRRIRVIVNSDNRLTEALQCDYEFLTQLAAAKEEDFFVHDVCLAPHLH